MNNPLVTVNILSFNRKDELRITLTKVFEQDYKNIEVIVVDNASSDGTQEMVKNEFPEVKLIGLKENIGIAGWNKGFEAAKGDYVLVLDDDSYPENGTIRDGLNRIIKEEDIGIVAFNVINLKLKQSQTVIYKENYYIEFIGCGAIIVKKVFIDVGGFDNDIFIYAHERDFAVRVLSKGYKIAYLKNSVVNHMSKMSERKHPLFNELRIYHSTTSYMIILKKYLRAFSFIKYYKTIIKLLLNRFLVLVYFNELRVYIKILKFSLYDLRMIKKNGELISKNVLKKYDYFNVAIFDEQYIPRNKSTGKFQILIYYLQTLFFSKQKKINKISY